MGQFKKIPYAGKEVHGEGQFSEYSIRRKAGGAGVAGQSRVHIDQPLDKPEKPCSCCGTFFQPTERRRMLCYQCFNTAEYTSRGLHTVEKIK